MNSSTTRAQEIVSAARNLIQSNRLQEAETIISQGLSDFPDNADLLYFAGHLAYRSQHFERAIVCLEQARTAAPISAGIVFDLGLAYQAIRHAEKAAQCYRDATHLEPNYVQAHANLGFVLRAQGDLMGALEAFVSAVDLDANHIGAAKGMAGILGRATTAQYDLEIAGMLVKLYDSRFVDYGTLAPAAADQLVHLFGISSDGSASKQIDASNELLKCYLTKSVNTNPTLEFAFTLARRDLVLSKSENLSLAGLMGVQCFINEYVFSQQDDENKQVKNLKTDLENRLSENDISAAFQRDLVLFAMYAPLSDLQGMPKFSDDKDLLSCPELAPLMELTLTNFIKEQTIRNEIKSFSTIEDDTSVKVRGQYEVNPFPRWVYTSAQADVPPGIMLNRRFPHFSPPPFLTGNARILIAGAGTGQHVAHVALRNPQARILAFDLSKSSLAYAIRMSQKLEISNVEFYHGDILEAGLLDGPFDIVESVGVLHHMKDPIKGWRALTGLLRKDGVFRCGLYSERGRQGVFAARDTIQREGIGDRAEDIAAFRQQIFFDPPEGDFARIKERADFYTTSNVRDLLFHVHEDNYTPKRIHDEIKELGLTFIGFEEYEELGINNDYRTMFPEDTSMINLLNWEEFEKSQKEPMEGYVFWCQKRVD